MTNIDPRVFHYTLMLVVIGIVAFLLGYATFLLK